MQPCGQHSQSFDEGCQSIKAMGLPSATFGAERYTFNVKGEHNRPQLSHMGPAVEYKAE